MNNPALRRNLIISLGLIICIVTIWLLFIAATFVRLQLPSGADSYTLAPIGQANTSAQGTSGGVKLIKRGTYLLRFYSNNMAVGEQVWRPSLVPFAAVKTASDSSVNNKALAFMGDTADYITPLKAGSYLYLNRRTKAVELADTSGFHDISNSFSLSTSESQIRDIVVNILPATGNSALVTTTKSVFWVKNPTDIVRLSPRVAGLAPNFYAAAYDDSSNSLFLLNSYDTNIYRYNLDQPMAGLETFTTSKKIVQSIAAGGGKLILYSGNLPTTDTAAVTKYSQRYQTTPLIYDASNKQRLASLDGFNAPTFGLPSGSGDYIAFKQKFATTIAIYNTQTKKTVMIPAYDTSGCVWIGDTLYVARDTAIWKYDVAATGGGFSRISDIGSSVRRLVASGNTLTASTLSGLGYTIDATDTGISTSEQTADNLSNTALSTTSYSTSFTAIGGQLRVNTQSLDAFQAEGIGDQATAANKQLKAAFPSSAATFTINKMPIPGVYTYRLSGQ